MPNDHEHDLDPAAEPPRVLVVEHRAGSSAAVTAELIADGATVVRCQPADHDVWPCVGLAMEAECPLDAGVDYAVDVRDIDRESVNQREMGLLCAIHDGVPTMCVPPPGRVARTPRAERPPGV